MSLAYFTPRHGPVDLFRNPLGPLFEALRAAIHADWGLLLYGFIQFFYGFVLCFWYWKLKQLFRLYERGQIFGAETILVIKSLGLLCVLGGIFKSLMRLIGSQIEIARPHLPPHLPPGVTGTLTVKTYQMGFFSFDFGTGIDFGLLLAGLAIVVIAWIMDEGRKIQEEQELTV